MIHVRNTYGKYIPEVHIEDTYRKCIPGIHIEDTYGRYIFRVLIRIHNQKMFSNCSADMQTGIEPMVEQGRGEGTDHWLQQSGRHICIT